MTSIDNITPEYLEVIQYSANISQASSKLSIAIYSAFVYHFIATVRDEVELVWGHRWNLGSTFYFATRYLAAVSLSINAIQIFIRVLKCGGHQVSVYTIDSRNGSKYVEFTEASDPGIVPYYIGLAVLFCSMLLIQLRLLALYGNARKSMIMFGVLDMAFSAAFIVLLVLTKLFDPFIWIPLTVIELVSFLVTLWKTYTSFVESRRDTVQLSSLLRIVLRDNILYLLTILLFYAAGTVLIFVTEEFANPHFEASVALSGVIAPHIYLSLRKTQMQPLAEPSIPMIQFNILTSEESQTQENISRDSASWS